MSDLIKVIAVILFIALLPKLIILAGIYVVAAYGIVGGFYLLKSFFGDGPSCGSSSHESDPGDHWQGTGNPHM